MLSNSRNKKQPIHNNISANNYNKKLDLDHSLKNLKKDISNEKEIVFKRFSLKEINLRKNTDNNNINSYNFEKEKQKYIRESDNNGTKRNIRNEFNNKNSESKYSKLDEKNEQDNKEEIKKQVFKSDRFTNNFESHSFNKKEKQNKKSNYLNYQNQLKEKIEKIKIDTNRFSSNYRNYMKNKILSKTNYYTHDKNDIIVEVNNNKIGRFKTSFNNSTLNDNKNNVKKKNINEPKKNINSII